MKILIADDDESIRRLLTTMISEWGYEVVAAEDGVGAWQVMQQEDAPLVAVLDWNMPGMTGTDVIRNVRRTPRPSAPYLLLLTAKDRQGDIVEGLRAGASDYITKPFDHDELQARLQVGVQMASLQCDLAQRVEDLEEALEHVKRLQGLLPICSYCKKIRDDRDYWHGVEDYFSTNAEVYFSHGICPDCYNKIARPELDEIKRRRDSE
jgi:phosphoserine phosphatase RsbU/P